MLEIGTGESTAHRWGLKPPVSMTAQRMECAWRRGLESELCDISALTGWEKEWGPAKDMERKWLAI